MHGNCTACGRTFSKATFVLSRSFSRRMESSGALIVHTITCFGRSWGIAGEPVKTCHCLPCQGHQLLHFLRHATHSYFWLDTTAITTHSVTAKNNATITNKRYSLQSDNRQTYKIQMF